MNRKLIVTKLTTLLVLALLAGFASWAAQPGTAFASAPAFGQRPNAMGATGGVGQASTPLEKMLNRDGTLNLRSGFSGSLDPAGWQMVSEPGAPPRFTQAMQETQGTLAENQMANPRPASPLSPLSPLEAGDENWDDRFGPSPGNGMDSHVLAIAIAGNGDVYVGGKFFYAGGIRAPYIARWNGTSWSALGSGMNDWVYAIAIAGNGDVYAGGLFSTAGGVPANRIARWNGTSWSALGSGMDEWVHAIAIAGNGDVFAGGRFYRAGGVIVNHIARWDGTSWSALGPSGGGVDTPVYDIAIAGNGHVYVGGEFTYASPGVLVNRIAMWNGSTWSALGTGLGYGWPGSARVYDIAIAGNGHVYAGGWFAYAGEGVIVNHIARWDGTSWSALGSGMNNRVEAVAIAGNGHVYAGGLFTTAGGVPANRIARWDIGTGQWHNLGSGTNGMVSKIAAKTTGTEVYVVGQFLQAGGKPSMYFGIWHDPLASPPPPAPCTIQFVDVPATHTFYDNIRCLACRGVLGGYSDGTFRPGNNITRGQLSKVVANAGGYTEAVSGQTFTDVPPTDTFYPFIERMARRGIIGGYNDGTFRPGNPATRGQISKIVANAKGFVEPVSGQTFIDVPTTHTFYEFIERMATRGIIGGYADGTFRPGNNATRGQVAKIVANAFFPGCQTP